MISPNNTSWRKAVSVSPCKDCRLHVTMEDDEKLNLDLTHLIANRESFWRLRNFRYFRKVAVAPLGGLCWPDGEDISPGRIPYYAVRNEPDSEGKEPDTV